MLFPILVMFLKLFYYTETKHYNHWTHAKHPDQQNFKNTNYVHLNLTFYEMLSP